MSSLITERRGRVCVVTLNNPELRNALSVQMYTAAIEAFETIERDPEVGAVVLTGAGGIFCAGGNLRRLLDNRQLPREQQASSIDQLHNWISTLRTCSKPIVAAVEGAAAGAGFSLALACDMLVAADNAKFVMSYVNVALSPDGGATWQLVRSLPRALAAEAAMLGKPLSAATLQQHGLVNRVVPPGSALDAALELACALADKAPNTLQSIKDLLNSAQEQPLHAQLEAEKNAFVVNLFHANAAEGISAFLDKRTPAFKP